MAIKHIADGTSLRYIGRAAGSIAKSTIRIAGSSMNAGQVVSKTYMAMEIVQAVKDHKALSPDQLSYESYDFFRRAVERSVQTPIAAGDQLSVSFSDAMSDAGQIYEQSAGDAHTANGLLRAIKNREPLTPEYYLADRFDGKSSEIISSTLDRSKFADSIKRLEAAAGSDTKYLFGRILTGEVDVDKVLSEGQFEGRELTAEQVDAFGKMRIYARSGAIAVESQNRLLAGIGWKSGVEMLDFNDLRQVSLRAREFGDALDASCPVGKCPWSRLDTKHIENILDKGRLSKETITLTSSQKAAAEEYLKLRLHTDHLKDSMRAVRSIRSRRFRFVIRLAQKISGGDSDLLKLINSARQTYNLGKTIIRTGKLSAKITIRLARMALRTARTAWHIVRAGARLVNRIPAVGRVTETVADAVRSASTSVSKKVTGSKAGKAAEKAADRVKSFSDTLNKGVAKRRAARQAKAARKAANKASRKAAWAKKHPKLAARKAAKAAKVASKKAVASAGKAAGATIGIGAIALILLIIFIVFMLVLVVALLDSGFFVSEFWTEEDRTNLLSETAVSLRKTTSANTLNSNYADIMWETARGQNYFSAVDLNAPKGQEVIKLSDWQYGIQETASKATVYAVATGYAETIPVNAYSTARLSMAIANAFVSNAEKISDVKTLKTAFVEVAYLSHYSFNNITKSARLIVTEASTHTHTYSCYDTSDLLYMKGLDIVHCQFGDILPVESRHEDHVYTNVDIKKDRIILVGDSTVATQTADGCRYRRYTDITVDEGAIGSTRVRRTTATKQGNDYVAGDIVFKHFSDLTKNNSVKRAYREGKIIAGSELIHQTNTTEFSVRYMLDPYISSECAEHDPAVISDIKSSAPGMILNNIKVHKPGDSDWNTCTNKAIRYCNADCEDAFEGVCPGHEVCLGHYTCPIEHHYCPGHSVQYSTGDILYRTEIVIDDKMFSYPLKEVELENVQLYLTGRVGSIELDIGESLYEELWGDLELATWFDDRPPVKLIYSKLCDTYDFKGFDDLSYHLIQTMLKEDWYEKYGIASRQFAGYSLSPSEQEEVLSSVRFPASMAETEQETRLALLEAACESVGKIPYYPGGKAVSSVYDENAFGWSGTAYPEIIENGTAYRSGGLGRSGLIHYLWWVATGEDREDLFVDDLNDYGLAEISGNVQPGDILAFVEDGEVVDVAVFARFTASLTPSQAASANVLKNNEFWFFQFGNEWTELNISTPAKSDTGKWMRVTGVFN